jgi:hypothetical protein
MENDAKTGSSPADVCVIVEEEDAKRQDEKQSEPMEELTTTSLEKLQSLLKDVEVQVMAHVLSYLVFPYLDKCFRWPIALLTLLTGTSMWSSSALTPAWFFALACIQGIILFLMILQFYYEFDVKSQQHFQAAVSFSNLYHRLHHQWFKHERRQHGLPPWGMSMIPHPSSPEEIQQKWSRFFETIELDFEDIPQLPLLPWIHRRVSEWSTFQGWCRLVLFHHFRSRLSTHVYTVSDLCRICARTRTELISFLIWSRQPFQLNSQWTIRKMSRTDIECMNKEMLLMHILVNLNLPIELWNQWSSEKSHWECCHTWSESQLLLWMGDRNET